MGNTDNQHGNEIRDINYVVMTKMNQFLWVNLIESRFGLEDWGGSLWEGNV